MKHIENRIMFDISMLQSKIKQASIMMKDDISKNLNFKDKGKDLEEKNDKNNNTNNNEVMKID